MKNFKLTTVIILFFFAFQQGFAQKGGIRYTVDELDSMFKNKWDKAKYHAAHTAEGENYLTQKEKDVYYYLNLARLNPRLFSETYAMNYQLAENVVKPYAFDSRKKSLIKELKKQKPLPLLQPDKYLYELAKCLAEEGGKQGLVTHDRKSTGCKEGYKAECCTYGNQNALDIVMSMLIDAGKGNEKLGHRRICLSDKYKTLGVSVQPHRDYGENTVLDFGY